MVGFFDFLTAEKENSVTPAKSSKQSFVVYTIEELSEKPIEESKRGS